MLSLFLFFSLLQSPVSPEAYEWFQKGEALIGTEKAYSDEQAEYFAKAVELAPSFAAARYNLALIYINQSQWPGAEEQLSGLILLEPDSPRGYLLRSEIYMLQSKWTEMRADLERALKLNPASSTAWARIGQLESQDEKFENAAKAYEMALRLDPTFSAVLRDLGIVREIIGNKQGAVDAFQQFLKTNPDDFEVQFRTGFLLRELERIDEAFGYLEAADRLRPNDPRVSEQLALLYIATGQKDLAEHKLRQSGVESGVSAANLGIIAKQEGRWVDAELQFRKALARQPDDEILLSHLGDVLLAQGRYSTAVTVYNKAIRFGQESFANLNNLGIALANANRPEEAEETLTKALQLGPNDASAHFHMGVVLERLGRGEESVPHYLDAVRLGSTESRIHFRLAVLLSKLEQVNAALDHLEKALEMEPEKYGPLILAESKNIESEFDAIRYTSRFSALLKKHQTP